MFFVSELSKYKDSCLTSVFNPEILNFHPFQEVPTGELMQRHSLTGGVVHSGPSTSMGYYYAYVKNSMGTWFLFDD